MKRLFIIHGWDGAPDQAWFPWLKQALEERGWSVSVPAMPDPETPEMNAWVTALADLAGSVDEETFFVGHSIGCQTIMRFLAALPEDVRAGGAVFVAGWFNLVGLETEEERTIAAPWLTNPIDTEAVKKRAGRIAALFSDDDPVVPIGDAELFQERLDASVRLMSGRGHFDEATELSEVRDLLLEFSKS